MSMSDAKRTLATVLVAFVVVGLTERSGGGIGE